MKNFNRYNRFFVNSLLTILITSGVSCKKFVDIPASPSFISDKNLFQADNTAIGYLSGIYANISSSIVSGTGSISLYSSLSSDDLSAYIPTSSIDQLQFYKNDLTSVNSASQSIWNAFYKIINTANIAIEQLSISNSLTPSVKNQLLGEAKFMRAFSFFYLLNLYGDIPMPLNSDYSKTSILSRERSDIVYSQIIKDLQESELLLSPLFLENDLIGSKATSSRFRPIKPAASALLARVYLFTGRYVDAEKSASDVIDNSLFDLKNTALDNVFLTTSKEVIWQLQPVLQGWNTEEARLFILPSTGPGSSGRNFFLDPSLISSYESGDNRRSSWIKNISIGNITYFYPFKYKSGTLNASITEGSVVFRLAEMYLIRAEARAEQGRISGANSAIEDVNVIRTRAGLTNLFGSPVKETIMQWILKERQTELFTEWGHRWLDLKRLNLLDAVMVKKVAAQSGTWKNSGRLYPIPLSEINTNPNLKGKQNPGYQ